MSLLKVGAKGKEVFALQYLLNAAMPWQTVAEDGDFGVATLSAVLTFQKHAKLYPDGVVGDNTWRALHHHSGNIKAVEVEPHWMAVARKEIGQSEIAGKKHNQRIVAYHQTTTLRATDDETPWCSSFVNWVMEKSGYRGSKSAAAKSWLSWGVEVEPKEGAIVVIQRKVNGYDAATGSSSGFHVGFLNSVDSNSINLLGGNQGDTVKYSNFMLRSYTVRGYRWPSDIDTDLG